MRKSKPLTISFGKGKSFSIPEGKKVSWVRPQEVFIFEYKNDVLYIKKHEENKKHLGAIVIDDIFNPAMIEEQAK